MLTKWNTIAGLALSQYRLRQTHYSVPKEYSENMTFFIRQKKTGKTEFVLRIARPHYHSEEALRAELSWLTQLRKDTDLVFACPIPGKNGDLLQHVTDKSGRTYRCILFNYLSGTHPDAAHPEHLTDYFFQLGTITAALHQQVQRWELSHKLKRPHWNYDAILGTHAKWGAWQNYPGISAESYVVLNQVSDIIRIRLKQFGTSPNQYGLIHADMRMNNVITEQNQLKLIDFDDCGHGWFLFDLAASLSFLETHPMVRLWIYNWCDGYRKVLPMDQSSYNEIETFIMLRRMQLMAWLAGHSDSDPVPGLRRQFYKGTMQLANQYFSTYGSCILKE